MLVEDKVTGADRVLGQKTPWLPITCSPWRVAKLLESSGLETQPYVTDSEGRLLVPPTYLSAQYINTFDVGIPDAPVRLNGGNGCHWEERVYAGDVLERQSTVVDVSRKMGRSGDLVLYKIGTLYRRSGGGQVVARAWNTAIRRYPHEAGEPGPEREASGGRLPESSEDAHSGLLRGAEQVLSVAPSSRDLVRYAVATDDLYEGHYDQEFARSSGLPGVIVHGLLKLAWLARGVVEYCGPGSFVREISGSYRGIDLVGQTFTVWCADNMMAASDSNARQVLVYGVSEGGTVSTMGTATVQLGSDLSSG